MFIVLPNNLVQFIVMIFPGPLALDPWFCFYFLLAYKFIYLVILHLQHSYVYLIINGYIFTFSVHLGHLKLYKFEEMRIVTNNFSQKQYFGRGGIWNSIQGLFAWWHYCSYQTTEESCFGYWGWSIPHRSWSDKLDSSSQSPSPIWFSALQTMKGSLWILTCQMEQSLLNYKVSIMLHCHIFYTVATSSDVSHVVKNTETFIFQ